MTAARNVISFPAEPQDDDFVDNAPTVQMPGMVSYQEHASALQRMRREGYLRGQQEVWQRTVSDRLDAYRKGLRHGLFLAVIGFTGGVSLAYVVAYASGIVNLRIPFL